jgi:hypothetical protein
MNSKNPHKNLPGILFLIGLFFLSGPTAAAISGAKGLASAEEAIRAENLSEKIHELASPAMEGRGSGTPGEARAADYIAREFHKIGLKPAGDRESYFQPFDITLGVGLGKDNRRIIFSSNLHNAERRSFSLYLIDTDGGGLERLTEERNGPREFNIFIADWIP